MNRLLSAVAVAFFGCVVTGCPPSDEPSDVPSDAHQLTPEEIADGWILLFDGESTFGWEAGAPADWQVQDGTIVVTSGDVGLLHTTTQFSDYLLKVDFRAAAGTDSGVLLRTSPAPESPQSDCYEVNISAGDDPYPTASLVDRKAAEVDAPAGQWHTFEIRAEGGEIGVALNGEPVLEYVDPEPLGRGHIGLQHHSGKVEFRNVKLKPLGLSSLFNGKDLTGWVTYPDMKSVFSVNAEGHLHVKDGKGQLETEKKFGDFVLQLECITNGKHLNSGMFFRCIPGDEMMGYESQIHNGYEEGDRSKPIDCGTGGIFRRQEARKVMADDFEWFAKTIVAEGPHMAVWVNGVQVSDWTDERDPNENPRRGLRLEPGTIIIQGHDPTTDISFRNIRAGEMPVRRPE
jgi:hypothetical protein